MYLLKLNKVKSYWDKYYKSNKILNNSKFSKFLIKKIKTKKKLNLIDVGCGDGRDSFFFNKKNFDVLGIDLSNIAIKNNLRVVKTNKLKNINFKSSNLKSFLKNKKKFDIIYCRFLLHAIDDLNEKWLLKLVNKLKKKYTKVFFEYRNSEDKIFKKGKKFKNSSIYKFGNKSHFRRKIDDKKFIKIFSNKCNMNLIYKKTSYNLSKFKNENPSITRLIFKK